MKFYLADKKAMTVWPCSCVDDMEPLERRLWPVFWRRIREFHSSMVPEANGGP